MRFFGKPQNDSDFKASPITCYRGGVSSADGGVLRMSQRKFSVIFVGADLCVRPLIGSDCFPNDSAV